MEYGFLFLLYFLYAHFYDIIKKVGGESKAKRKKKQSKVILITILLAFIIGTTLDIILPYLFEREYPDLSIIFSVIPVAGLFFSIEKYKLMALSPKNIAADILNTMNDGLIVTDNIGRVIMVNQASLDLLNYNENELLGENFLKIINNGKEFDSFLEKNKNGFKEKERLLITKNKKRLPVLISIAILRDEWGDKLGLICTFSNIKERIEAEKKLKKLNKKLEEKVAQRTKKLEYLANHDNLTELPNRRSIVFELSKTIDASNGTESIMIAMLDLDGFKEVNDTLGHDKGDLFLKEAAQRIENNLRENDIVARYGGDEFLIKCKGISNKKSDKRVVEKIMNAFQEPFEIASYNFDITVSIGIVLYPLNGKNIEDLTIRADKAMYKSKKSGKNQYTFYDELKD